jgi:guanylate kinase
MSFDKKNEKVSSSSILFCIVGPAGVGKSSLVEKLILERKGLISRSISSTTRTPRSSEKNGREYFFLTHKEFKDKLSRDEFLEWEDNHGELYGTSKEVVDLAIDAGKNLAFVIDIRGAASLKAVYPLLTVAVFIAPRSFSVLDERIRGRGAEEEGQIQKRLETAKRELKALKEEIRLPSTLDYLIVNQDLEVAYKELEKIFDVERLKIKHWSKNFTIDV